MPMSFAHPHPGQLMINGHTRQAQTEHIPLTGMIGIEKTTLFFHAPENNQLPWGFVEGKIANPVNGYPIIIQFFQEGEAKHFAQVDVADDNTYEYKFRVLNIEDDKRVELFDGDYTIVVFKVVYLNSQV
ncbi:MAG: hypothetical protein R3327_06730 [Nitrosopumilaceae archaeon]|nr:hypothetical protein [Nitrosopumilaceae archaeon]